MVVVVVVVVPVLIPNLVEEQSGVVTGYSTC